MNGRRFAASLIATALIMMPVALVAPASRASAASGCIIYAARPAQVVSTHNPLPVNPFYLAVNDPYAAASGAVNNQASLALDPNGTLSRPGFIAAVRSANCSATSATVSLVVTSGNGITFRVGDPMTINLYAYGSGQYTITDIATNHVVSQMLTTLVIIP